MIRMNRKALSLVAAAALLPLLAGCDPFYECPSIPALWQVELHTQGEFASLEVCADDACVSSVEGSVNEHSDDLELRDISDGEWTIGSQSGDFGPLTVRAYDAAGTLVDEQQYDLEWTPTYTDKSCAGVTVAPDITLAIP